MTVVVWLHVKTEVQMLVRDMAKLQATLRMSLSVTAMTQRLGATTTRRHSVNKTEFS